MNPTRTLCARTLGFALAVLLLSGCDREEFERGPTRTEMRDVGAFTAVDMDGDGKLQIEVGAPASLTLEGKQSVLEATRTQVRGDTLHIKSKRKDWIFFGGRQRIVVRITVPRLDALELEGGNEVKLTGFNGGDSRIKVQGAAHLEADGTLKELTVYMAGAGHADFSRLVTDDANVTVEGVGSVYVNSRQSLDATMNGVGRILYTGSPHAVSTTMNGLGTISQAEPEDLAKPDDDSRGKRAPIDPDSLQPEYDKEGRKGPNGASPSGMTEVI